MTSIVPQSILDRLTDVTMPRLANERPPKELMTGRRRRPACAPAEALVLGSGAAGLRAAVELKRRDVDVVSRARAHSAARRLAPAPTSRPCIPPTRPDEATTFGLWPTRSAPGGAMDEDTAYVEAVGSSRALASLQFMGLPLPQDRLGGVLRYQTDHDEVGRATSCGPRTSRLMVQVLDPRSYPPRASRFSITRRVSDF